MYIHEGSSHEDREQHQRWLEAHKRVNDQSAMVDDADTLPPAIDWREIAELATRAPSMVNDFFPSLTVRSSRVDDRFFSGLDVWNVEGRVI